MLIFDIFFLDEKYEWGTVTSYLYNAHTGLPTKDETIKKTQNSSNMSIPSIN